MAVKRSALNNARWRMIIAVSVRFIIDVTPHKCCADFAGLRFTTTTWDMNTVTISKSATDKLTKIVLAAVCRLENLHTALITRTLPKMVQIVRQTNTKTNAIFMLVGGSWSIGLIVSERLKCVFPQTSALMNTSALSEWWRCDDLNIGSITRVCYSQQKQNSVRKYSAKGLGTDSFEISIQILWTFSLVSQKGNFL